MISSNSRYATDTVARVTDDNGITRSTIVRASPVAQVAEFTYYRVVDGDTIQAIANVALNDPTQWWKIADINPEIMQWYDLTPGVVIRIPA